MKGVSNGPTRGPGGAVEILVGMSTEAVMATFGAYGLLLTSTPPRAGGGARSFAELARDGGVEAPTLGALLTFVGPRIRGELLLASTFDVVAPTRPGAGDRLAALRPAARVIMMRDWMGELANQALGRLKSALMGMRLAFETGSPVPLSAEAIAQVVPKAPDTRPVLLRGGMGGVAFWLDCVCDGVLDPGSRTSGPPREGKLILF